METAGEIKSEQRIRYEAEIALIRKRFGSLETMRRNLGLSQRKMAELLMVDPSAWTRWTKDGKDDVAPAAPPHVYRALAWYMEVLELRRQAIPAVQGLSGLDFREEAAPPGPLAKVKEEIRSEWRKQFEQLKTHYENELALVREQSSPEAWEREKAELLQRLNQSEQITLGWKLFLLINTAAVIYLIFGGLF